MAPRLVKIYGSLTRLQPEFAWRKTNEDWQKVQAEDLVIGNIVRVRAGELIPADGPLQTGQGLVNEAMLTGEARPVNKDVSDMLYAGTVVEDGLLVLTVTSPPAHTRLAQITRLVVETLSSKPPIQRLADRVSTYFAFGILGAAALTFAGWLITGHSVSQALLSGVAVLVVACPCALGLATPLALSTALSQAARQGVLVRSPAALETAAKMRRVVFDKTGTLTRGDLFLDTIAPLPGSEWNKETLVQLAASVEQFSAHPLAAAILRANTAALLPATQFVAVRGLGASARVMTSNPEMVGVGSERKVNIDPGCPLVELAKQQAAQGKTIVWVDHASTVIGFLALQDQADSAVQTALDWLRREKIDLAVLSGDTLLATQAVARQLGIETYDGSCLPEQKAARIRSWQDAGEKVAMVGDGVNDAPALAQADLSITVAGGSDVAGQTSDLILTRSDLTLVPWFIQISRHTRQIILENLGWAFAYNLVAVPLAIFGIISPVIAAVAMAASSLLVVLNSAPVKI